MGRREGGCNDEDTWEMHYCLGRNRACKTLQGVNLWKHALNMHSACERCELNCGVVEVLSNFVSVPSLVISDLLQN